MPPMERSIGPEKLRAFCFEDLMALRALGRMREQTEHGARLAAERRGSRADYQAPSAGGYMAYYDLFNRLTNFSVKPPVTRGLEDLAVPINYACFNTAESELVEKARSYRRYL